MQPVTRPAATCVVLGILVFGCCAPEDGTPPSDERRSKPKWPDLHQRLSRGARFHSRVFCRVSGSRAFASKIVRMAVNSATNCLISTLPGFPRELASWHFRCEGICGSSYDGRFGGCIQS